uniref:phosphate ABC transporter substrate-binding protein n=1 Tax=Ningiella ruwaisensis TaxID=2364274 RepID=UPI0010A017A2|nr:phosphate ABC transporter substrate-binding protein [Ningiella ruwaisensis]
MLKTFKVTMASAMLCLSAFSYSQVVVVVNPANDASIDAKTVQRIFLGKEKKFSNGNAAIPINQTADNSVRAQFDESIVGRSSSQVSAYWSKLVFTGKGVPPEELSGDAAVIEAIANNPNAIGYVDAASVTDAVKTIPVN